MKQVMITLLLLTGYALPTPAQKNTVLNQVTKEQISKLNEIVSPVKETIDKILAERFFRATDNQISRGGKAPVVHVNYPICQFF